MRYLSVLLAICLLVLAPSCNTAKNKSNPEPHPNLHDIWIATEINGQALKDRTTAVPRLEINLTKMMVYGSDGCNEYSGPIERVSATELSLGDLLSTLMLCQGMEVPDLYNAELKKVSRYQIEGLKLILMDKDGQEVLVFQKGD